MIPVNIILFATLREKYKTREIKVSCDGTIKDLLIKASEILGSEFLEDIYDEEKEKIRENIIFMINGRNIKDLNNEIKLNHNDVISIFPPLAGG